MKILVVCQYYSPEPFKIAEICEQLAERGHSVTVLTGLPNYPSGKVPSEYRWPRKRTEVLNGVKVLRSFEVGRRPGAVGLALNYVSYMLSASIKSLLMTTDFDVVFVYQLSPVTMAFPAVIMKRRARVPILLYCLDIWPESMKNVLTNEDGLVFTLANRFSRHVYSRCDAIAVTSESFMDYLRRVHDIPEDRIAFLPQFAEDMSPMPDAEPADGCINFVFMGNIGIAQDIDCILDAVELIGRRSGFMVHFVGDGSYFETSKKLVRQRGLDSVVTFHGRHSPEDMSKFYALADACLLTLKADNLTGLTMPGKLQGYMAAGIPVIGAINGVSRDVIEESNCGVCVDAGDAESLAAAMRSFIEKPDAFVACGPNGRRYFERHFTKERFMNKLETALAGLVSELPSADRPQSRGSN